MDISDLFLSCRKGDLTRVKYLVEQKDVELNIRDKWDSSPLYYACLCGHDELVRYLLDNGARCEANTFDGERCLYGALNTDIRNLLRNYKVITSQSMRRDSYEEFLRKLLETAEHADITFVVNGQEFRAHRCVLSARCEYFCQLFKSRWRQRSTITIANELVCPDAFMAILKYLYTGRLETHKDQVEDCILLARQCKLPTLIQQLEDTVVKNHSFECTKPGTNVTTIHLEPRVGCTDLQQDFRILAEQGMPVQFCNWVGGSELPFSSDVEVPSFFDLCFVVEGRHFLCHKAFFCSRSDYFLALLRDHFSETAVDLERHVPIITIHNVTAAVFAQIVYYIYQNKAELSVGNVYDILCAADVYLLPGLKRQCAVFLGMHLESDNVINLLQAARLFELPRLEDQCAEFIARHLEQMVQCSDFHRIIVEDAQGVKGRQETDSICIVDDVRYHITGNVQTYSEMEEANERLQLIDELLEDLCLDA